MAVAQSRGMPWAGGRTGPGPASSGVSIFGAKGLAAPGLLGTSPLPQIGTLIPGTPYIYVRPRLSGDPLNPAGGSPYQPYAYPGAPSVRSGAVAASMITQTNPEYQMYRQNRRTASIGVAGAGSVGVTMDVPFQSEVPYFSHSVQ